MAVLPSVVDDVTGGAIPVGSRLDGSAVTLGAED
jgi:hypothetical protein